MTTPDITRLADGRRPVMVVSHERSGTHFLMNALAACFDYVSKPWVSIDQHRFNINFYSADNLHRVLSGLIEARLANTLKSHHEFAFFAKFIAQLEQAIDIVYIYRNPADVMASYWRYLHTWPWAEGPEVESVYQFANTPPMGALMRLQFRQYDTMLDRWASHVQHWTEARRLANLHVVRYEDLKRHYGDTMRRLGEALRVSPRQIVQPSRYENVVPGGKVAFTPRPEADDREAVTTLALSKYPELMASLGYVPNCPSAAFAPPAGRPLHI
jgi:hypothetical protein